MNINIIQNKIKNGLTLIGKAISKGSTLPILKNVYLKTEKNHLYLIATDLEIAVKWCTLSNIEEDGEILIPFDVFYSFINLLPNKKINLKNNNNDIKINCEEYKTEIKGFNSNDFPVIPEVKEKGKITIKGSVICDALLQIVDIPSTSKIKPEISGVLFSCKNNELNLVATDTYRLAEKKIIIKEKINDFSFILPQRTVKEVINIFKEIEDNINIIFDDNQIVFQGLMNDSKKPFIELTSKVIEGNYPDYEKIIPKEEKTKIIINKDEFINKIKASSVFSSKVREVLLKVSPQNENINIKSNNVDVGNYETEIKGRGEGLDIDISFNYKFLIDGLSNIKSSEIIFIINEEDKPGIIKPVGKNDYIYVVMPIKK